MKITALCVKLYWKPIIQCPVWKLKRYSTFPSVILSNYRPLALNNSKFTSIHTSPLTNAKSFQDRENEYAHSVMENHPAYKDTLVKINPSDKRLPSSPNSCKELSEFAEVTYKSLPLGLNLENDKFNFLIKRIADVLPDVSDDDLIKFLHYLCLWSPSPKSYSPNFKLLWNSLDFQCVQRLHKWYLNRKLRVADYWFCLRLNRISKYNERLILSLLQDIDSISDTNVVQLMFLVNLQRNVPRNYMKPLEDRLLRIIQSSTIEEIGVICLGFFKTENTVHNIRIIKSIISRYCGEVKKTETLTANAILKFLKKSMVKGETELYLPLLPKSLQCVANWDVPTSIHLTLLATECHVFDHLILNTVTKKVADNIEEARIKDCIKLLQCHAHFNLFPEPTFNENLLQELNKETRYDEIERYPRDLAYAALYYAYLGHYNHRILSTVLKHDFIAFCTSENPETVYSFSEIDYCIEIECQDYKGPRIPKESLKILAKRRGNLPTDSKTDNILVSSLNDVLKTLKEIFGSNDNILVRHVLPHCYSPDIILRLSSAKSESMSTLYGSYPDELLLKPPPNELWACFIMSSPYSFAYKSRHLIGMTPMKLRQLEKLGYKTVFIPYQDLPLSDLFRKKYLTNILKSLQIQNSIKASVKL